MTEQTLKVEGLPEGWKAVAYRKPLRGEHVFNNGVIKVAPYGMIGCWLIVEEIQPRRIVLEETDEDNITVDGTFCRQHFCNGLVVSQQPKRWREVKGMGISFTNEDANIKMGVSQGDGDDPRLELSVDECKEAMRKLETFNVTDLSVKICRFLKESS